MITNSSYIIDDNIKHLAGLQGVPAFEGKAPGRNPLQEFSGGILALFTSCIAVNTIAIPSLSMYHFIKNALSCPQISCIAEKIIPSVVDGYASATNNKIIMATSLLGFGLLAYIGNPILHEMNIHKCVRNKSIVIANRILSLKNDPEIISIAKKIIGRRKEIEDEIKDYLSIRKDVSENSKIGSIANRLIERVGPVDKVKSYLSSRKNGVESSGIVVDLLMESLAGPIFEASKQVLGDG